MDIKRKIIRIDFSQLRKERDSMLTMANPIHAIDVAKWFIKNDYDTPTNCLDGNMKLQKLLYFSQLVHLAKTGNVLFTDNMYAFEKGTVIENIRTKYKDDCNEFRLEAKNSNIDIAPEQLDTINIVADIFGDICASELSDLNHLQKSWKDAYKYSLVDKRPLKALAKISIESIVENDLEKVKEMLSGYYATKECNSDNVEVNGIKFYYDSSEIEMSDEIIEVLKDFEGEDSTYSLYYNDDEGLVIY